MLRVSHIAQYLQVLSLACSFIRAPLTEAIFVPHRSLSNTGTSYKEILKHVYNKWNYTACEEDQQPGWLRLYKKVDCTANFNTYLKSLNIGPVYPAPEEIPSNLRDQYLLNGYSLEAKMYINEPQEGVSSVNVVSRAAIEQLIHKLKRDGSEGDVLKSSYQDGILVAQALDKYPITGRRGAVLGSQSAWVEATAMAKGASEVITIEYQKLDFQHEFMSYMHPKEVAESYLKGSWAPLDWAISFSSHEHSGLGRYGDPLDPNGDLIGIEQVHCLLKPSGLLFLGVPMGVDCIVFNAHRVYGKWRLPMITANFDLVDVLHMGRTPQGQEGVDTSTIFDKEECNTWYHAVAVLRKIKDTDGLCL